MLAHDQIRNRLLVRFTSVTTIFTTCFAMSIGVANAASATDCLSPRITSPTYTGDHESGVNASNQRSWRMGTLAITTKPAADIVVGYKLPSDQNWHDSKPISSKNAVRLLLKIGTGDVQFSTLYRASSGSSACNNPPATTFSPSAQQISSIAANTTQPTWPTTNSTSKGNNGTTGNPGGGGNGGGGGSY